ncbi:uncharacterized protein LOC130814752 [Amaranthus tricolor]|uniref:uncharacterized protein LOC130814752 n=1 Tax=Amaranthus tricolor TaxID=29722 RepID=UPI0025838D9C|nr:uncharacterized protein LOC130814752 [Amaranthus tricolor]
MASKKKEPEVFNLLNLYQDDDDEDDDMEDVEKNEDGDNERDFEHQGRDDEPRGTNNDEDLMLGEELDVSTTAPSTQINPNSTPKWTNLRPPTPQQGQILGLDSDVSRPRRDKPSIVDYAHDDVAMSPEHEEGEFVETSAGRVMYGDELGGSRDFPHRTPTTNVQTVTPNNQMDSPQNMQIYVPEHNAMKETETDGIEGVNSSGKEDLDLDPVHKFLPPPPEEKCSDELQEKINKFLAYKRQGKSFNVEVRNRKDYRNPDFLRHAVRYQDIDEIGSCFCKDVFDPHGYDESDFFDAIEADMKREVERKEQERKKNQKVEYVSGGTLNGVVPTVQKSKLPSPGVSNVPSAGLQPGSADTSIREGRQNKKSKWDKVDGDRSHVLGSGQDTQSSVGAHAALLSAASAGAGYAVFAQQKRREADEKRSSDKKAERRS